MATKQSRIFSTIILILALALSAFALIYGRARSRASTTEATTSSSRTPLSISTLQGNSPPNGVEAELITIRPTGFEPEEITRPAGRLLLAFDNQSGLRELVLRLEREGAARMAEVRPRRKSEFTRILDLPPGLYHVTEANHPEWGFRLRLTGP